MEIDDIFTYGTTTILKKFYYVDEETYGEPLRAYMFKNELIRSVNYFIGVDTSNGEPIEHPMALHLVATSKTMDYMDETYDEWLASGRIKTLVVENVKTDIKRHEF